MSNNRIETGQKSKCAAKTKDNNSVGEDRTSTRVSLNAVSSHTQGNINDQTGSPELTTGATVEHDMATQSRQTTDIPIPLQALNRSPTVLSLEERIVDRSAQATAPHHEDFYQHDWFSALIILIFAQALFLSLFVLLGAYGAYDSGSVLAPSQNPVLLFQYILTWVTLYAPGNIMIYAAFQLFPRALAHWKWRTTLAQWYYSRFHDHIH
jgi:hypothetical protein